MTPLEALDRVISASRRDPMALQRALWPNERFYREQRDIVYSVENDDETVVTAGNMLGKDYISGFIGLSYFIRKHPVKIITSSATEPHLNTLWGEMDRFIRTSRIPLTADRGGPLVYNHREIRKVVNGTIEKEVYLLGRVASSENRGEGLSGHHAKYTLWICDEASGVPDVAYSAAQGWAKRMLIIGNPNPTTNFFYKAVIEGSILAPVESRAVLKARESGDESMPNE